MLILKSVVLFIIAGFCEIGGGYLIWQWLRNRAKPGVGLIGAIILIIYGVVPVLQTSVNFGRVYAAYGGVFIVMSLLWGWKFDKRIPDKFDITGACICLIGVAVMMYWPRK